MARFGDLEAAIMDVVWAVGAPVRVREVSDQLNQERPLAFNTVHLYEAAGSRDDYVSQLLNEALSVAPDPAATLVRLVGRMDPEEIASLRAALDAATSGDSPR